MSACRACAQGACEDCLRLGYGCPCCGRYALDNDNEEDD